MHSSAHIRKLLAVAPCIAFSVAILPALAQSTHHEARQTGAALHNYANRKVVHADKAVAHAHAHYHHYVHRKASKARNWLNRH